jgi:hypothetical protein
MAGTQFSSDSAKAGPGRPNRGAGQRRVDREQRRQGPRPQQGQPPAAGSSRGDGQQLGFPQGQPPEPEAPPDLRHVQLLAQHVNMQGLGRESLFGNRVAINGDYRSVLGAGRVPFDVLEDL